MLYDGAMTADLIETSRTLAGVKYEIRGYEILSLNIRKCYRVTF